jgi:hypothetical protein
MSEAESVTVEEGYYDKLENIHCGVIKGFKITCGPEMSVLNDGDEHQFEMTRINAKRKGGSVTFSKG